MKEQPTSNGKNRTKPKHYCECGNIKNKVSKKCKTCRMSETVYKFEIDRDTLGELINNLSYTEIGKLYGVSDNTVKKRCQKYGIIRN